MCRNATDPAVDFSFRECSYVVQTTLDGKPLNPATAACGKKTDKVLIHKLSANVGGGHVLAILGPSGAGKTTLLNMLTLQKLGGRPVGHIYLNGHAFTLALYNKHAAYVQQHDALWASLTTEEHLELSVELFQPGLDAGRRATAVADLVRSVGLIGMEKVKAGNIFTRGLSGGMKRRLSIALALSKQPSLLFLDEPTTGVDSASASQIMSFLKELAAQQRIAVLCTIHQPPASVFAGFDDNLILASGRIAYFGSAAAMGDYFAKLDKVA
jgi:ABC-type multidrug transport system ATPase subunit